MKKSIESIKYWGQLLLLPIYWFSFLIPRNKNIWLFGSTFGRRFADNPRYLYTYITQEHKNIKAIWITHNKEIVKLLSTSGFEAYYCYSLKGIWYSLRGKVYIFDNYSKDINFWTSGGAIKINLWHGVGNKRINYDNEYDFVRHPRTLWERMRNYPRRITDEKPSHYILATAPIISQIFTRAFQVDSSHIIQAGYPRNDTLFKEWKHHLYTKEEKKLVSVLEKGKKDGKTILGYIPTFRLSEKKLIKVMDLYIFNEFLKKNNMFLVYKFHPKSLLKGEFEKVKFPNMYHVASNTDVNSFLAKIDILITDYSSVYSDFMLLDRPAIAFHYDFSEYAKNTRGTYFKFEEYMPEIKATTMEELMEGLNKVVRKDTQRELRKCSRDLIFKRQGFGACKEVTQKILDLL